MRRQQRRLNLQQQLHQHRFPLAPRALHAALHACRRPSLVMPSVAAMDPAPEAMVIDSGIAADEEEPLIQAMEQHLSLRAAPPKPLEASAANGDRMGMFVPGEVVTEDTGFMRGHGTYADAGRLVACVAGRVEPVNRLVSVRAPPRARYVGEVGDVVVGRVMEVQVQQKRWKVDTGARLHSILLMSSVNLPGGELRRKTQEDEQRMRTFFSEGDLISAEVQALHQDGSLSLHTRSLRYGRLGQGTLVQVPPALVQRRKTHLLDLPPPAAAHVVLGCNGAVWIARAAASGGGFVADRDRVPTHERQVIARLAAAVRALATNGVLLHDSSIAYAFEESLPHPISHLMRTLVARQVAQATSQRLQLLHQT